jgi:hypothetical protein
MLKFLAGLIDRLNTPSGLEWNEVDLLQHPVLARMSERELADLPLVPIIGKRNAGRSNCPA